MPPLKNGGIFSLVNHFFLSYVYLLFYDVIKFYLHY